MAGSVFKDRVFVVTGTLSGLSRKDAEAAITQAGGRITGDVSKNTNVLVVGDKPGSKVTKAESLGVEIWDEKKLVNALKQAAKKAAPATKAATQPSSRQTRATETTTTITTAKMAPTKRVRAQTTVAEDAPSKDAPATDDTQPGVGAPLARDGRSMRVIELKFPASCRSCHGGLTAGMAAWWAKGEPPLCLACAGVGEQPRAAEIVEAVDDVGTDAHVARGSTPGSSDRQPPLNKDGQPMRLIALKFASVCRVCSTGLDAGLSAWWAKGESPICVQCGNGAWSVAENTNTPGDVLTALERLATDQDENVRWRVAGNVSTPGGVLERLATDEDWRVRQGVAYNVNTPAAGVERLATDQAYEVRQGVAGNVNTPVGLLERLATDKNDVVREEVAGNVNTAIDLLEQLATDSDGRVRRRVAGNPSTPVDVLELLAQYMVRDAVAMNVSTPVGLLERLATDEDSRVRKRVAGNVSTPVGLLERLATDEGARVRKRVAGNASTPVGVLEQLATDEDQGVRTAVWGNPHASEETRVMAALLGVFTNGDPDHNEDVDGEYDEDFEYAFPDYDEDFNHVFYAYKDDPDYYEDDGDEDDGDEDDGDEDDGDEDDTDDHYEFRQIASMRVR